jgi:rod shape-determining protein MreD
MAASSSADFRLGRYAWPLVPTLTVAIAILLTVLPYGFSRGVFTTPAFALIPVFFWATYKPDLLPIPAVFLLGLSQDLVTAGPVGLWAMVFLITYSVTLWQSEQIEGQPFRVQWLGFAAATAVGSIAGWFLASVYFSKFLQPLPVLVQAVATTLVFPLVAWLFVFLEREVTAHQRH